MTNPMQTATTLLESLRGAGLPSDDPRLRALDAAILTRDEGILEAALAYIDRGTTDETRALMAIKARLVSEASDMPPRFVCVVDVAGVNESSIPAGRTWEALCNEGAVKARHAFALVPDTTTDGRALACRVVFPSGISPAILEATARCLRDLAPSLMQSRNADRAAALTASLPLTPKA